MDEQTNPIEKPEIPPPVAPPAPPTSPKPKDTRERFPGEPDDDGTPFRPYTPGIDDVAGAG